MGLPVYENLGISLACSLSNAYGENTMRISLGENRKGSHAISIKKIGIITQVF